MKTTSIFTVEDKEAIGRLFLEKQEESGLSATKFARTGSFKIPDFSNLKGKRWKENPSLIGEGKWIRLARFVGFTRNEQSQWKIAKTAAYVFIHTQLDLCKNESACAIFCDEAGIGKSVACREYAQNHHNVLYIDCSLAKTENKLKKELARTLGLDALGGYDEIGANVVYALSQARKPLVILDEAGDLNNDAIRYIKSLYNQLEYICGFYLVGAEGLKKMMDGGIGRKQVGFAEVFSRFGADYSKLIPADREQRYELMLEMATDVLIENGVNPGRLRDITNNMGRKDLRAVYRACLKLQAQDQLQQEITQ